MNIRSVKKKIKTIDNVKKITRAMELVSAIKMKKSQQEAIEGRPYQETIEYVIQDITQMIDTDLSPLLNTDITNKPLIVIISTNKGLCGSFNYNLFRYCYNQLNIKNSEFIILGKKAAYFINKLGGKILADFSTNKPITAVSAIFNLILTRFLTKQNSPIEIVYNQFISRIRSEPVKKQLLPVQLKPAAELLDTPNVSHNYLIEPAPQLIIDSLLRSYVEQKIRHAIISSEAGEHSARMMAMKNATDNAKDLIDELTLTSNHLRQEKITYELLDMITATQSVEN